MSEERAKTKVAEQDDYDGILVFKGLACALTIVLTILGILFIVLPHDVVTDWFFALWFWGTFFSVIALTGIYVIETWDE
jgi:hypothetical protein